MLEPLASCPPKAEVTGSNPVGCAKSRSFSNLSGRLAYRRLRSARPAGWMRPRQGGRPIWIVRKALTAGGRAPMRKLGLSNSRQAEEARFALVSEIPVVRADLRGRMRRLWARKGIGCDTIAGGDLQAGSLRTSTCVPLQPAGAVPHSRFLQPC